MIDPDTTMHILLAEDDPEDVLLLKRAIQKTGVESYLHVTENGHELVAALKRIPPDKPPHIIVLDLKMPKMDGHEALAAIRSNPETEKIPVIVLTSSNSTEDIDTAYKLGADSYHVKPSSFEELLDLAEIFKQTWLISKSK